MPIFEYECTECGERTEHLQMSSTPPLTECPKCGGKVRKLLSAPAFQFKGTGWYVTDYADKGKASAKADGGGSKEGEATSDAAKSSKKESGGDKPSSSGTTPAKSSAKTSSPSD